MPPVSGNGGAAQAKELRTVNIASWIFVVLGSFALLFGLIAFVSLLFLSASDPLLIKLSSVVSSSVFPIVFAIAIIRLRAAAKRLGASGPLLRLTLALCFYLVNILSTVAYLLCVPFGLVVLV